MKNFWTGVLVIALGLSLCFSFIVGMIETGMNAIYNRGCRASCLAHNTDISHTHENAMCICEDGTVLFLQEDQLYGLPDAGVEPPEEEIEDAGVDENG